MVKESPAIHRKRRASRPLDAASLEELALAYVARFATSAAKLEGYLARKLRERGWAEGEAIVDIPGLVERYAARGYVDDAAYARMRAGSLLRRGYGSRRIGQALGAAGIGEDVREDVLPDAGERRQAALVMASKRRIGPFGAEPPDPARREKQIAAMLRAGHELGDALALVDAESTDAAEDWAQEAEGE